MVPQLPVLTARASGLVRAARFGRDAAHAEWLDGLRLAVRIIPHISSALRVQQIRIFLMR